MAPRVTPWFRERPEALAALRADLGARYPQLHAFEIDDRVVVRGTVALVDGDREVDRYELEIGLPDDYTKSSSTVHETAGRIPRIAARHVNPDSSLCLGVPDALWLQFGAMSLIQLLDGPVRSFLAGNTLVEAGQPWPHGEWDHGTDGMLQFYAEQFGTTDTALLLNMLALLNQTQPKWQKPCPCRSGRKLRDCHAATLRRLRDRIPAAVRSKTLTAVRTVRAAK